MLYDKTSLGILELIYTNPGIHKRALSKQLKVGMPSIDFALKKIKSLIIETKTGNQINFSLDYSREPLTPALCCIESGRLEKLPSKIALSIHDYLRELKEKPLIAIIFGSYANSTYTKASDIDLLLVFQKIISQKNIESTAKMTSLKTDVQLNPVYMEYHEFRNSFHDPTNEFFRNVRKDKIIITGHEWWRQLKDEET